MTITTNTLPNVRQCLEDVSRRITVFTSITDDEILMMPHMEKGRMERLLELNEVIRQQAVALDACLKQLKEIREQIGGAA